MRPPLTPARAALGLLLLEVLLVAVDLVAGPGTAIAPEEARNARAGLQLACGHWEDLWALQYRSFCGGCTAEAALAAPLFSALGDALWTWKLVPAGFHLATVSLGALLAARAWGTWAASAWLAWMIGAPAFYRELALTGYGNHTEGTAWVLAGVVLALAALDRRWQLRVPLLVAAGAVTGLGVWFTWSSAYGLAALALVAALAWRRGGPLVLLGLPAGLLPMAATWQADPAAAPLARDLWSEVSWAGPGELWRWLGPDFAASGLWQGALGAVTWPWWGLTLGLAALGVVLALRERSPARAWLVAAPLALVAAYALRHDLWHDTYAPDRYSPFLLRYRAPLVPLVGLLVAGAALRWRAARIVLVALVATGLLGRVLAWSPDLEAARAPAYVPTSLPDPTVAVGQPPVRHAGGRTRPQDLAAALDWLSRHADPLPVCRLDHLTELGRRLQGHLDRDPASPWALTVHEALPQVAWRLQVARGRVAAGAESPPADPDPWRDELESVLQER